MSSDSAKSSPSFPPPPPPAIAYEPKDYKKEMKARQAYTQFYDPCAEANKAAMDCMNRHSYDREKCLDFFRAYRECKSTWMNKKSSDMRKGLNVPT